MASVEDLFATLGLKVKEYEWATGDEVIDRARKKMLQMQVEAQRRSDRAQREAARTVQAQQRQEAQEARVVARAEQLKQRLDTRQSAQADRVRANEARAKDKATAKGQKDQEKAAQAELKSWQRAGAQRQRMQEKSAEARKKLLERTHSQAQVGVAIVGGLAAYFGQKAVRAGIEFNSSMEESKNQVAGMMALTKKTHLTDELKNADTLVENLSIRAAALPGTTAEYVHMLGMITKPIMDAKLSMKDLEDLTVNAVVAAKAFGIGGDVAARDVDQALRGQYHSVDPFSSKVLTSIGYGGEAGRTKYNQLSDAKRASEFKRGLLQPQIAELGEAQGKSFKGMMSTLQDTWERFMGAVTVPLFKQMVEVIKEMNVWFGANKAAVAELAATIGGVLVTAFKILVASFKFLVEHGDAVKAILIAILALWTAIAVESIIAMWPVYAVAAYLGLVAYWLVKIVKHWDDVKDAASAVWEAIKTGFKAAFDYIWESAPVRALRALVDAVGRLMGFGATDATAVESSRRRLEDQGGLPKRREITNDLDRRLVESGALPRSSYRLPGAAGVPGVPGAGGVNITGGVQVNVNAPNADAGMVANAVGKKFDDRMGGMLRRTMDVVK